MHGAALIRALQALDGRAQIQAWGGDRIRDTGAVLLQHYKDIDYMGFVEVIQNLPKLLRAMARCKKQIQRFDPDILILIDYPGFNLRIAQWAKNQKIKSCYYIAPQVWAWRQKRVFKIKKSVDLLLVILPFEPEFYAKYDMSAQYVGHPLLEHIDQDSIHKKTSTSVSTIALLPGSRMQEITKILPIMLRTSKHFPQMNFVVIRSANIDCTVYQEYIWSINPKVTIEQGGMKKGLQAADFAIVTSGTATLETALYGVPQIVVYKGSPSSYWIAKRLVKVDYISLVNLILDKKLIVELIQEQVNESELVRQIKMHTDSQQIKKIKNGYKQLYATLGDQNASRTAARAIWNMLKSSS